MMRALSFAKTEPKGPVYCYAGREAMEEYLDEKEELAKIQTLKEGALQQYEGVERSALSPHGKSSFSAGGCHRTDPVLRSQPFKSLVMPLCKPNDLSSSHPMSAATKQP